MTRWTVSPAVTLIGKVIYHGLETVLTLRTLVFHRPIAGLAGTVTEITICRSLQVIGHFQLHTILTRVALL
jgi:hypothetical protein